MTLSLRTRHASNTALIKCIGLLWMAVLTCWHLGFPTQSIGGTQEIGIIRASNLNMRPEPGTHRAPLMKLQPGSRVTILEHTGPWLKIFYNGQTGYVRNKPHYIKIESHQEIGADPPAASKHRPDQATPKKIDHLKHTAAEISDEIEKSEVRVLNIKKEERAVVSRLNDIDLRLDGYGRRLRKLKSDLRVLDQRIAKKSKAVEALERDIQSNELYAAKRLVALYKLTWLGHLPVLGSAESLYEFVQRKSSLERILVEDENIIERLVAQKKSLQIHLQEIQDQKKEQRAVEKQLDQQIQTISIEKNKRTHLLQEIRSQHSLELAAIEALKKSAQDLDRKITFFTTRSKSEPRQTEPPEGQRFIAAKGLLNLPVNGKIISFFGPFKNTKYNVVNYQSGINIKADRGEPIQAVHAGRVLFASWFKGYGNMIILDHGDHYYTVYAHAEEVFKAKGDLVEAGEVIATVGDSGSMIGPALHFEVRHHGKPEDPLNWIKKG